MCSRLLLQDSAQSLHNLAHMLLTFFAEGPRTTKAPAHIEFIPLMSCSWHQGSMSSTSHVEPSSQKHPETSRAHIQRSGDPALGTDGSSPIWQPGKFTLRPCIQVQV